MSPAERRDLLLKKILRYDFYLNSVNIKASVIITWNGILIGGILLKYYDLIQLFHQPAWASYVASTLFVVLGVLSTISICFAFLVIFPFLDSGRKKFNSPSLFFFGDVSALCFEEYLKKEKEGSSDEIMADLASQAHILARGLYGKMVRLQRCTESIIGGVFCMALLMALKVLISLTSSVCS